MSEQLGFNGFIARHMAAGLDRVFEVLHMDAWLDAEVRCESEHRRTGKESCTVEVTHLVTVQCKGIRARVCAVSAATEYESIARNPLHKDCLRPYEECTSVVPFG